MNKRFRLRTKVLEQIEDGTTKFYMVAMALAFPEKGLVTAYAMSDEKTLSLVMSVEQYNRLPFRWFLMEEQEADRPPVNRGATKVEIPTDLPPKS